MIPGQSITASGRNGIDFFASLSQDALGACSVSEPNTKADGWNSQCKSDQPYDLLSTMLQDIPSTISSNANTTAGVSTILSPDKQSTTQSDQVNQQPTKSTMCSANVFDNLNWATSSTKVNWTGFADPSHPFVDDVSIPLQFGAESAQDGLMSKVKDAVAEATVTEAVAPNNNISGSPLAKIDLSPLTETDISPINVQELLSLTPVSISHPSMSFMEAPTVPDANATSSQSIKQALFNCKTSFFLSEDSSVLPTLARNEADFSFNAKDHNKDNNNHHYNGEAEMKACLRNHVIPSNATADVVTTSATFDTPTDDAVVRLKDDINSSYPSMTAIQPMESTMSVMSATSEIAEASSMSTAYGSKTTSPMTGSTEIKDKDVVTLSLPLPASAALEADHFLKTITTMTPALETGLKFKKMSSPFQEDYSLRSQRVACNPSMFVSPYTDFVAEKNSTRRMVSQQPSFAVSGKNIGYNYSSQPITELAAADTALVLSSSLSMLSDGTLPSHEKQQHILNLRDHLNHQQEQMKMQSRCLKNPYPPPLLSRFRDIGKIVKSADSQSSKVPHVYSQKLNLENYATRQLPYQRPPGGLLQAMPSISIPPSTRPTQVQMPTPKILPPEQQHAIQPHGRLKKILPRPASLPHQPPKLLLKPKCKPRHKQELFSLPQQQKQQQQRRYQSPPSLPEHHKHQHQRQWSLPVPLPLPEQQQQQQQHQQQQVPLQLQLMDIWTGRTTTEKKQKIDTVMKEKAEEMEADGIGGKNWKANGTDIGNSALATVASSTAIVTLKKSNAEPVQTISPVQAPSSLITTTSSPTSPTVLATTINSPTLSFTDKVKVLRLQLNTNAVRQYCAQRELIMATTSPKTANRMATLERKRNDFVYEPTFLESQRNGAMCLEDEISKRMERLEAQIPSVVPASPQSR